MKNRTAHLFVVIAALFVLLANNASMKVSAQGLATTTPAPNVLPVQTVVPNTNTLYFYQIAPADIQLIGPLDSESITFGLPADWKLTGSAELTLNIGVTLSSVSVTTGEGQVVNSGGLLSLEFNRNKIGTFPINQKGETSIRVEIPREYLQVARQDGLFELTFTMDSGLSCLVNQQMSLTIHSSSQIIFPHENVMPDTALSKLPFPIYQNSIYPDTALFLVPENPSAAELQSAMTVAAGFANLTNSGLVIDMAVYGKATPEQLSNNHIILIGKGTSISGWDLLDLPLLPVNGKFQSAEFSEDDGIVEMTHSPWNQSKIVLVVSGNTDAGVVKAAQAISTGNLRTSFAPNLSVIIDVAGTAPLAQPKSDQTLLDLGYPSSLLERRGVDSTLIRFHMPPGWTAGPDAYFELAFGHSALLDYDRSGLVVEVNGQPIGSVRFTDVTASQAINRVQIAIPASVLISGINELVITSSLQPIDNCSSPILRGLWVNIWSESRLHLSPLQSLLSAVPVFDLQEYPAPFTFDPTLSNLAFVMQADDVNVWRNGLQVAAYLGGKSNGSISLPQLYFADALPDSARSNLNLVLIGNALHMPIIKELNQYLPAPFDDISGIATENSMQVTFRIPSESPVGYVQLLRSPWNPERIIIAALGNTTQGVEWSASGLYKSSIRSRLAGNFAIINDQQVTTADTRLGPPETGSSTIQPDVVAVPPVVTPSGDPVPVTRPIWILPALVISLVLMIAIIVYVLYGSYVRNRTRDGYNSSNEVSPPRKDA